MYGIPSGAAALALLWARQIMLVRGGSVGVRHRKISQNCLPGSDLLQALNAHDASCFDRLTAQRRRTHCGLRLKHRLIDWRLEWRIDWRIDGRRAT